MTYLSLKWFVVTMNLPLVVVVVDEAGEVLLEDIVDDTVDDDEDGEEGEVEEYIVLLVFGTGVGSVVLSTVNDNIINIKWWVYYTNPY